MTVKTRKLARICSNPKCRKSIYEGDRMWKKGGEPYCHSSCLITSFAKSEPDDDDALFNNEKVERIKMMNRVYRNRKAKKANAVK